MSLMCIREPSRRIRWLKSPEAPFCLSEDSWTEAKVSEEDISIKG